MSSREHLVRGRQIEDLGVYLAQVVEHHGGRRSKRQHARECDERRVVAFRRTVRDAEILPVAGRGGVLQA